VGVSDVERWVRRTRWRHDLHALQRATYRLVAAGAVAVVVLVALALLAGPLPFAIGLVGLVTLGLGAVAWTLRSARREWLGTAGAPAWIDRRAGLRGRVATLAEVHARGPAFFLPLLVAQATEALSAWPPERLVPRVVPVRALACAGVATAVLVALLVLSPLLRPPLPGLVAGGDGRLRAEQMDGLGQWLRRIVAAATQPSTVAGRDVGDDATGATAGDGTDADAAGLGGLPGMLQARIRQRLWGERWGRVDGAGSAPERGRTPDDRHVAGGGGHDQRGTVGADPARRAVAARAPDGAAGHDGDAGTGAGAGSDPDLFGPATNDADPDEGHFALGLAARVRATHQGPRRPTGDAPAASSDEHPELAGLQRPDVPFHRASVPPAYDAVVRAVFAHRAPSP
jgi:hypothetical protein